MNNHTLTAAAVNDFSEQETPAQGRIPTGPVGVVARGKRPEIPDNRDLWADANAVTFGPRSAGRRAVYRAVVYFAGLTKARQCFASVATIAERAGMGATAARSQLRALERDGHLEPVGTRKGGRMTGTYRLTLDAEVSTIEGNAYRCPAQRLPLPTPTVSVAEVGKRDRGLQGEPSRATACSTPVVRTHATAAARAAALETAQPAPLTGSSKQQDVHPPAETAPTTGGHTFTEQTETESLVIKRASPEAKAASLLAKEKWLAGYAQRKAERDAAAGEL